MTRVLPRFPTAVRGINALSASTENGVLEIGIDPTNLAESADPTAPGNMTFILNTTTDEFELAEVASTVVDISTQAEAEAGTDNTAINTPLRTKQQTDARIASQASAEAGIATTGLMSELRVRQSQKARELQTGAPLSIFDYATCDGVANDTTGFAAWIAALVSTGRPGHIPLSATVMLTGQQITSITGNLNIVCEGRLVNRDGASATQRMLLLDGDGTKQIIWKGGRFDANGGAFSCLEIRDWAYADVYLDETTGITGSATSTGSTSGLVFSNVRVGVAGWGTSHDMAQGGATVQGSVPRSFSVSVSDATRGDCCIYPGNDYDIHGLIVVGDMAGGVVDVFGGSATRVADNGVYNVGDASEVNVYDLRCDDIDEMFVNSGSGIINAYRPIGRNMKNSIGLQNCDAINVFDGDLQFAAGATPFKTRGGGLNVASGALRVYRSRIRCNPSARVIDLGSGANGTCNTFIDIDNRWQIEIDGATMTSPTIFSMTPGSGCIVESDSEWIAFDKSGGTPYSTDLIISLPTVTELSYWKKPPISKMVSAGVRIAAARQQLFTFSGGFSVHNIQSEREPNQADRTRAAPREVYGTTAPTSGVWRAGDISRNPAPSDFSSFGFLCVADGTPGTWRELGIAPRILKGTATLDLASIAAGAVSAPFTITVTGATTSDVCIGISLATADAGVTFRGKVSSANTVTGYAQNNAGGSVDLPSATVTALVMKT